MNITVTGRRSVIVASGVAIAASMIDRSLMAADRSCRDFAGKYRHKGGDSEKQQRDDAIDDVVEKMNLVVRGIARSKLKKTNVIPQSMSISDDGKSITTVFDTRTYTAPIDGGSVKVNGITGEELELHYEISSGSLFQFFRGDEKGRVNGFFFDGDDLKMRVRVYASKLPKDLVYTLTYEKV